MELTPPSRHHTKKCLTCEKWVTFRSKSGYCIKHSPNKFTKHTEETRKKISEKLKGNTNPKGYKWTEDQLQGRRGGSSWNKGMKMPLEYRKKLSEQKKGKKHPNWQGGKTSESKRIRVSLEYRLWRESVFDRDDYTCQHCKVKGVFLHADHIKPFAHYPELRFDIDNGRTLCEPCHKKTDTYLWKAKKKDYAIDR